MNSVKGSERGSVKGSERGSEKGSPIKSELRSESSKQKLTSKLKYFKVLLNPILTKLDVAIGDLVHMIGAHLQLDLNKEESKEGKTVNN